MIKIDFNPKNQQLSQFGWIALLGFPLLGFMIAWNFLVDPDAAGPAGEAISSTFFFVMLGVGIATLALSLVNPRLILPIYVGLMIVALPIGLVISFILMGAIYYLLVTPLALFFKLIGRDKLERTIDRSATSYWHVRETQPSPASYLKQY